MSTYSTGHNNSGYTTPNNSVRHSKEDALSEREFELLLEGAGRMKDYYGQQAQFLIHVLGRLALRRGELAHMREGWIDTRQNTIKIPLQQDCHGERKGIGICGYCKQLAKQRESYNEDMTMKEAIADQWHAKTPAAAREVYFGFDARVELHISRFFEKYDSWRWSAGAVNRRIKKAAEHADGLERNEVRPHSLRATAATAMAGKGLEMHALMQHFGWAQASTAKCYLARNPTATARQLDSIHQG